MKHANYSRAIVSGIMLALSCSAATAQQCNAFVKKKCMMKIAPFTNNGQMNTSVLTPGQNSEMNMTFYAGQDYRILVCSEEKLGEVSFQVMDLSHKVLFDSKQNNSPDFWDFKVKNTQQLIVHVNVPPANNGAIENPGGCVSVMIGFKKS